ncbi:MAG: hypothetical protein ACK4S4_05735 [Pyrinomonadaceae bacterium]
MKQFAPLALGLCAALSTSCGSQPAAGPANSSNASNQAAIQTIDTSNVQVQTPTEMQNSNAANPLRSAQNPTLLDQPAKPPTYPAPDNSEYSPTMNKDGLPVETRTFKSHPQIVKAVRSWLNTKDKKVEIFLKNGKVVNVPAEKLENFNSLPVTAFEEAAGIKAAPQSGGRPAEPGKTETKKQN